MLFRSPDVQTLALGGDIDQIEQSGGALDIDDPFTKAMLDFEPSGRFLPPVANREMLLQMEASDVFVVQWGTNAKPTEYYRNMLPEVPIVLCHSCNHFFHEEDWESSTMSKGVCPFCRSPAAGADAGSAVSFPPSQNHAHQAMAGRGVALD